MLYMLRWCKVLKQKLVSAVSELPDKLKLKMLKYYVDDGNIVATVAPLGAKLCQDGIIRIIEENIEGDRLIADDCRTASLFTELGNSISSFIKLTADFPTAHQSGWMPVLDFQVRMGAGNKIEYKFYSKPMASPFVILESSAMPARIKRNSLIQEGVRRLRNTSRSLAWEVKADILSEFSNKLRVSGYKERYRLEVIQAKLGVYDKQCSLSDKGVRPLHRPREYQQQERWKSKKLTKTS